MGKVEIRRWDVLDIFYYKKDRSKVVAMIKKYRQKGWTLETDRDTAGNGDYDESSQLMKVGPIKTKNIKK